MKRGARWWKTVAGIVLKAETVSSLAVGWIFVFVMPFRMTVQLLGRTTAVPAEGTAGSADRAANRPAPPPGVWRVTHAVCRVAPRLPWSCTCLVNALGAHLMLRRRGIRSVVRLGARIEDGKLQAHAWLLAGGETVLGGKIDQDFAPLAQIERSLAPEIPPKQSERG